VEVTAPAVVDLDGASSRTADRCRRGSDSGSALVSRHAVARHHARKVPAGFPAFVCGVAHELSHALVHPKAGLSPHSILGFWPSRVSFYANYDGEMSRNRLIAILLMPLLTISIVPLLVSAVIQVSSGWVAFFFCIQLYLRLRRHVAGRLGSLSDSSHCDCPL